ncbi:hypothetical protein SAMN04488018_105144 [Myroides marinus]|uniref:Uncharacterized protein n=1 Tax=Myroides marinus TaxID=703342 RepID=A0A1H6U1L2_9FLAO|nr:hypothetical protein [Myroides marinus]SEI83447.1 hypothetical protein SAMN04488018_105144 [Myroides marinus]
MAIIDNKGNIRGKVGPTITRIVREKNIMQTTPRQHKKHENTLKQAKTFGGISKSAKKVRDVIQPFLGQRHDPYMYNRFNSIIANALKKNTTLSDEDKTLNKADMFELSGFDFNIDSLFRDSLLAPIQCEMIDDIHLEITVPSFSTMSDVLYPPTVNSSKLRLMIYEYQELTDKPISHVVYTLDLDKNQEQTKQQQWVQEINNPDRLVMVVTELLFYSVDTDNSKILYNSKSFNPAAIVYVKPKKN